MATETQPKTRWSLKRAAIRAVLSAILFVAGVSYAPYLWCSRGARPWFEGDKELQCKLAAKVADWVGSDLSRGAFHTGSRQFNGEWLFGTYLMAGMGFGQVALEHPQQRPQRVREMEVCVERLLSPAVRAFDREAWGNDPLDTLNRDFDHAAYLGYLNLLLGFHRLLDPASKFADINDRIAAALARRIEKSPILLIESYPNEVYPVDNCAAIASIAMHGRAGGQDRSDLVRRWVALCREKYVDRRTGLLYQCVNQHTGAPADHARGSGTTLALYFLAFADPAMSRDLHNAVRRELARTIFGFGGIREYPASVPPGTGDIDSGPVVLGFGLSPTGFALAGSRMHGDTDLFGRLYATAYAWGAPYEHDGRLEFVTGGPLGDAILFAMLTARIPR